MGPTTGTMEKKDAEIIAAQMNASLQSSRARPDYNAVEYSGLIVAGFNVASEFHLPLPLRTLLLDYSSLREVLPQLRTKLLLAKSKVIS
jgi:hypothetical protein